MPINKLASLPTPAAFSAANAAAPVPQRAAPDIQGWHDWVEADFETASADPIETRLATRAGGPALQAAFLSDYRALRTQHIADSAAALGLGLTPAGQAARDDADASFAGALTDLVSKYFPTLSTDPNNTERMGIETRLYHSGDPQRYLFQDGGFVPEQPPSQAAMSAFAGVSSFQ